MYTDKNTPEMHLRKSASSADKNIMCEMSTGVRLQRTDVHPQMCSDVKRR